MEPLIPHPTLGQRIDLMAIAKPELMRRNLWFSGVLGLWSAVGLAASLAARQWGITAVLLATTLLSGLNWWVFRRSMRNAPATQRWVDELQRARGSETGD